MNKHNEKILCPAPFTSLILNPDGRVGCCREKTNKHIIGHLKIETIEEIWNGENIRKWRREFIEQNIVTCKKEILHRDCYNQPYNQEILKDTMFDEVQKGPILRLSPDFNGECNLQCVMCDIWKMPNGFYDEINFWEYAQNEIFPYLKVMDPLSGEPFIQKDTFRLIENMNKINPDCKWRFTTNGHWKFTKEIERYLDSIDIYFIQISIDAISKELYSKIRYPGRIDVVLKNIEDFVIYRDKRQKAGKPFEISLNMTVQKANWHEVPDMFEYSKKIGVEVALQNLYLPEEMSLLDMEECERKEVVDFFLEKLGPDEVIESASILRPLIFSFNTDEQLKYKIKIHKKTGGDRIILDAIAKVI